VAAPGFTALLVTHDVQEALMLATRVIVLSPRPATVAADLTVDLPYPRHRDNPALQALRADVLSRLGFAG
jgi:NitT/TauT family transport system ATP-binding protein